MVATALLLRLGAPSSRTLSCSAVWLQHAGQRRTQSTSTHDSHQDRPWSAAEDEVIKSLHARRAGRKSVVDALDDRTLHAVRKRQKEVLGRLIKPALPWTIDEYEKLKTLREQGLCWAEVHRHFPNRSRASIVGYYSARVKPGLGVHQARPAMQYTPELDEAISRLREQDRMSWAQIAEALPDASASSVAHRYIHLTPAAQRIVVPTSRTLSQAVITEASAMHENGLPWRTIATTLGVSMKAIASAHYQQAMGERHKPISPGRWTPEEDRILVEAKAKGRRAPWRELVRALPGRSILALEARAARLRYAKDLQHAARPADSDSVQNGKGVSNRDGDPAGKK